MDSLITLLTTLNTLSPLAVIALLSIVIYLLVKGKTEVSEKVTNISDNHLHELPEILATLQRIEVSMAKEFSWIRSRLNGHNSD